MLVQSPTFTVEGDQVRDGRQQVVILYAHPLLGEGLARLLSGHPDLSVELVRVSERSQAEAALAGAPDVVIMERTPPLQAMDLMPLAPGALLIDVGLDAGPNWAYHRYALSGQPDELLRVIRTREPDAHPEAEATPGGAAPTGTGPDPAPHGPPGDATASGATASTAARVRAALRGAGV
jgi:hypothetical protein